MIRPAVVDDLPRLMYLATEMHRESRFRDYEFDEGKVGTLILRLMSVPEGFCWVTESSGCVVGGLLATLYESWFGSTLVASDYGLFLHPKHRGGVAAMRLVKQYKEWAAGHGAECELGCNTGVNPDGYDRFVQCMGFRAVGKIYSARF